MLPSSVRRFPSRLSPTPLADATPAAFRDAIRRLPSGVTIVTIGAGDKRTGLTATSVSRLSNDPPTLIVCVDRASASYSAIVATSEFAVNVLAGDQREFAENFADGSGLAESERYANGRWLELPDGTPYLADATAVFDCEVEERVERHSHAIVIGRVRRVLVGGGSGALLFWRGAYDQVGWSADEISRAIGLSPQLGRWGGDH
jgi:flavin reductase (DIM6/NTAB) family NADH-FMN oxidoreductase RutF